MNRMKLGEILSVKHGWAFKGEYFAEDGEQSILTPGNFFEKGGFKPNNGKERYYTGTYPKEYLCHKGDLIVAMTQQAEGLLGSTALVPENNKYLHNQRIGLITCDEKRLNKLFAYYLFMTKSVREQLERSSSGTKVKHTSPEKIYDVEVEIPDVISQQKIANLLWSIDEKIANNNAINDNLEQQAKLLYNYWFIQFNFPDENGNPYHSSGGQLVWNKNLQQEIPQDWRSGNLYDIADYINGIACQKYRPSDEEHSLPVVKIREMNGGITNDTERVSSTIPAKNIISSEYVYLQLSEYLIHFIKIAEARKTTMGHITSEHLQDSHIILPPANIIKNFSEYVRPIYQMKKQIANETSELIKLRDWLIPMLMNGQATISD